MEKLKKISGQFFVILLQNMAILRIRRHYRDVNVILTLRLDVTHDVADVYLIAQVISLRFFQM